MSDVHVGEATVDDAAAITRLVHETDGRRSDPDLASTTVAATAESVAAVVREHGGLIARLDGLPVGAILFGRQEGALRLRVAGLSTRRADGIMSAMVSVAEEIARRSGNDAVLVESRSELPVAVAFWRRLGYAEVRDRGTQPTFGKALGAVLDTADADQTRRVGHRLAARLSAGDLVMLTGLLGAGKTTLVQGMASGLGVCGNVTSPTFVLSHVHPSLTDGPALVHVDAYRLSDPTELADLDLEAHLERSVVVVEWGEDIAEGLADDRLQVTIERTTGYGPEHRAEAVPAETEPADADAGEADPDIEPADTEAGEADPEPAPADTEPDSEIGDADLDARRVSIVPVGPGWIGRQLRSRLLDL